MQIGSLSLAADLGGLGSIPGQCVWDVVDKVALVWAFLCELLSPSVGTISPPVLHINILPLTIYMMQFYILILPQMKHFKGAMPSV